MANKKKEKKKMKKKQKIQYEKIFQIQENRYHLFQINFKKRKENKRIRIVNNLNLFPWYNKFFLFQRSK